MTNPYKLFGTNKDLEAGKGVTLKYPGFSIVINRAGGANKKFGTVMAAKLKPHRSRFDRGLLDDATSEQILLETYAETVVIGWSGVTDEKGKKIAYSPAACVKLFTDLPDLFEDVKAQANSAAIFRQENEAVEEKN